MKYYPALFLLLFAVNYASFAQEEGNSKFRKITLPEIAGYKTLKADFHIHSIFSDGWVWPTFRIDEALRDGLDVISVTEHMDFTKVGDEVKRDRNHSYELVSEYSKGKNILVINGAEISPRVPPYHNNALFLKDANLPFDYVKSAEKVFVMKENATHEQLLAPFLAAQKQGAFVVYNHPGNMPAWVVRDTAVFTAFNKELFDRKILSGIEVVNSGTYNVRAHQLAMKYNLTMLCNTDEHLDTYHRYKETHRPMTLVFATERTEAAVKEALVARRTALYFGDYLIARQPEAEPFFKSALKLQAVKAIRKDEPVLNVKLMNTSDLPFKLEVKSSYAMEKYPLGQVELPPHEETTIMLRGMWEYPNEIRLNVKVTNILVTPGESLATVLTIPVSQ